MKINKNLLKTLTEYSCCLILWRDHFVVVLVLLYENTACACGRCLTGFLYNVKSLKGKLNTGRKKSVYTAF